MGFGDFVLMFLLAISVIVAALLFFAQVHVQSVEYQKFVANITADIPSKSIQFYPNMRFSSNELVYKIDSGCSLKRANSIREALSVIERITNIRFKDGNEKVDISLDCNPSEQDLNDREHVIAGSAKPNNIINATKFFVILNSNVSIYRDEGCDEPLVSIHEILHALGFDHSNNKTSIMYPISDCNQVIDKEIITEVNRLYNYSSSPDLVIKNLVSNNSGKYINFEIEVLNNGLKEAKNVSLKIVSENKTIKNYDFGNIDIGIGRILTVQNLKIANNMDIEFRVKSREYDLDNRDNYARLVVS